MSTADPGAEVVLFVGGCDRSGTTIVSRLLAESASLVVLPEAYFHAVAFRRHGAAVSAERAIDHWRRRSWQIPAHDPRAAGRRLDDYLRERMAELYARTRTTRLPMRVVESTPENIEIASMLFDAFPGALLAHVVRDPRAVAFSLRSADFGPVTLQECARFWKQRIATGLAVEQRFPERVVRVRYEDAVVDGSAVAELVGRVPADPDFHWEADRDLLVDHTSARLQRNVTGPIDPGATERWRAGLRPRDVAVIEYECRELMLALGYTPTGGTDPRSSVRRTLDATRSALTEVTLGSARRGVRVLRTVVDS